VEFVVIGGFALAPHGYIRATKDLDIVPGPAEANLDLVAARARLQQARAELSKAWSQQLPQIAAGATDWAVGRAQVRPPCRVGSPPARRSRPPGTTH